VIVLGDETYLRSLEK